MRARDVIDSLTFVSLITIIFGIGFGAGMLVMDAGWRALSDVNQSPISFWESASVIIAGTALLIIGQVCNWAYDAGLKKGKDK